MALNVVAVIMGRMTKRILLAVISVYFLAAILTTLAEGSGLHRQCGCEPDCWCQRPGLRLFRWVTPKDKHHRVAGADKQARAQEAST